MKKVLVTGADGWIGSYCCKALERKGFVVIKFHSPPQNYKRALLSLVDIKATYLLHLAWEVTPKMFWNSSLNRDWAEATISLVRTFRACRGERAVVAGTCADRSTFYGRTKNAIRKFLEAYADISGLSSAYGRIFYLYGPYEKVERLIPSMILSLYDGRKFKINHPDQMVDFFHVEDVADALVSILDSPLDGSVDIGDGRPITLHRIGEIIGNAVGRPELIDYGDEPNPLYLAADINRLRSELNWRPKYNIYTGMESTIQWWEKIFMTQENRE